MMKRGFKLIYEIRHYEHQFCKVYGWQRKEGFARWLFWNYFADFDKLYFQIIF